MLVATPGQTAKYPLHSSSSGNKICHPSPTPNAMAKVSTAAPSSSTTANNNATINSNEQNGPGTIMKKFAETTRAATAASALMKTLAVRLNRGTEFLKGTVQKALISSSSSSSGNATGETSSCRTTTSSSGVCLIGGGGGVGGTLKNSISEKHSVIPPVAAFSSPKIKMSTSLLTAAKLATPQSSSARTAGSAAIVKLYTVPPTSTHRYPEDREREEVRSVDSLQKELCHFKPIRAVPITAAKCSSKSRGVTLKFPLATLAPNARKMNKSGGHQSDDNGDAPLPKLSVTPLRPTPDWTPQRSAFVCLMAQMADLVSVRSKKSTDRRNNGNNKKKAKGRKAKTQTKRGKKATEAAISNPLPAGRSRAATRHVQKDEIHAPIDDLILKRNMRCLRSNTVTPRSDNSIMAMALANFNNNQKTRSNLKSSDLTDGPAIATKTRKRKANADCNDSPRDPSHSLWGAACLKQPKPTPKPNQKRKNDTERRLAYAIQCRSPPLTRARLRQKIDVGLLEPLDFKKGHRT